MGVLCYVQLDDRPRLDLGRPRRMRASSCRARCQFHARRKRKRAEMRRSSARWKCEANGLASSRCTTRNATTPAIVFIDAVEPKNHRMRPDAPSNEPRFPRHDRSELRDHDETSKSRSRCAIMKDPDEQLEITLPITTPPAQVPKIASAGIALSPYKRNEKYSASEPRRRFLLDRGARSR